MANRYGRILYFILGDPIDEIYFGFPIETEHPIDNIHPIKYMDVVHSIFEFISDVQMHRFMDHGEDILFHKVYDRLRFSKNFDNIIHHDLSKPMEITVHRNHLTDLKLEWETIESLEKKYPLFNECAFILVNFLGYLYYYAPYHPRRHTFIIPSESMIAVSEHDIKRHQENLVIPGGALPGRDPEDEFHRRLNIAFNLQLWVYFTEPGMDYKKFNYIDYQSKKYAEKVMSCQEFVRQQKKKMMYPFSYRNYTPDEEKALIEARSRMPLYGQGFFAMKPRVMNTLRHPELFPNPSYIGWRLIHKSIIENPYRLVYQREYPFPENTGIMRHPNIMIADDLLAFKIIPKESPEPYFDLKMDDYIIRRETPEEIRLKDARWRRRLDYKEDIKRAKTQLAIDINDKIPELSEEEKRDAELKGVVSIDRGREIYPFDTLFSCRELLKYYKSYGGTFEWGYYDLKFSIDHINLYIARFGFDNIPLIANKIQNAIKNELFYILLFSGVNISACIIIRNNIISDPKYSLYNTRFFREGLRDFFPPQVRMALCQIMDDMMERIKSILKGSQFGDHLSHLIKKN